MERKRLLTRLFGLTQECPAIPRNGFNPHFKNNFATYGDIIKVLNPLMGKHRVGLYHQVEGNKLVTVVFNVDDDSDLVSSSILLDEELMKNPQKLGGMLTYYKRYNVVALFNLDTEVDDDGNSAAGVKASAHPETRTARTLTRLP